MAVIAAWCLYDWAYSAFSTIVVTFVVATYFVHAVAQDTARGTVLWAWTQAAAGLVVALTSAPLGAIADRSGRRRPMLIGCTLLMAGCTASLWCVYPAPAYVPLALVLVALATISFETATVFYNAMLPDVAPPGRLGRVSELAWGAGYAGRARLPGFVPRSADQSRTAVVRSVARCRRTSACNCYLCSALDSAVLLPAIYLCSGSLASTGLGHRAASRFAGACRNAAKCRARPVPGSVPVRPHALYRWLDDPIRLRRHICRRHLRYELHVRFCCWASA